MHSIRLVVAVIGLSLATAAFSGCGNQDLPEGVQTLTGTLRSTELSRVRRGTHVLEQEGKVVYFVESGSRNLRVFEGKEVTVTGTIEANTDRKALPVLVLKDIQAESTETRLWKIPALNMTLMAPEDWQGRTSGSGITFRLAGRTDPVLNVRTSVVASLPNGDSILVGVDQGRLVRNADTGGANVYVQHGKMMLLFQFTPPPDAYLPYLDEHFKDALRSVSFEAKAASSAAFSVPSGTGALTGSGAKKQGVCGGAAGFLCPSGQYCEITDTTNNIGVCRPIR